MRATAGLVGLLLMTAAARPAGPDPRAVADLIDRHVDAKLKEGGVPAAPAADDAEFLRRAYLDVTGRIPAPRDVHDFLADPDADKRRKLVDQLLESPRYAAHFANVWRGLLLPEADAGGGARFLQPGFEAWLRQRLRAGVGYDEMVRELLAVPIASNPQTPQAVMRDPERPNPLAFYAAKDAKPENLASTVSRLFLGVQIECAQCHDHPFAKWSREQFWSQAAFFAGIERQGDGLFAPLTELADRRTITPPSSKRPVAMAFLDDREPKGSAGPREELAAWMTARDNPFFAKAAANRLWGQFFGFGLVDPVDDFHDGNPPSHPELLDELAKAFAASGFDQRFLIRAICLSKAYRRTSARTHPGQDDPRLVARMTVKAMTGEQFFDSLALATGTPDRGNARREFLSRFAPEGRPGEPETSILQALTLMNGRFVARATDLATSPKLTAVAGTPGLTADERLEALYLATLSRKPTADELTRLRGYLARSEKADDADRLADVFWVLLNSAEFRLNH